MNVQKQRWWLIHIANQNNNKNGVTVSIVTCLYVLRFCFVDKFMCYSKLFVNLSKWILLTFVCRHVKDARPPSVSVLARRVKGWVAAFVLMPDNSLTDTSALLHALISCTCTHTHTSVHAHTHTHTHTPHTHTHTHTQHNTHTHNSHTHRETHTPPTESHEDATS